MTHRDDESNDETAMHEASDAAIDLRARAYRDMHDGSAASAAKTRAAILRKHDERSTTQTWLMAAAILLVALIGLPTAWALYTGRIELFAAESEPDPGAATATDAATAPATAAATATEAAAATEAVAATEADTAPEAGTGTEPGTEPGTGTGTEPGSDRERRRLALEASLTGDEAAATIEDTTSDALDGVSPAERQAYDEAHALHFDRHDAAGAVSAWERYLADYPHGRFALEAAYNRALALVRLGRSSEARAALEPFASGEHGAYRRTESAALLEALDESE